MPISAGDVVRTVCRMTDINGSFIENVYHWWHGGSSDVFESAFLIAAEAMFSTAYTEIQAILPDSLEPLEIAADVVGFVSGVIETLKPVGDIAWTTWGGGTATSDGLPQGAAAVVNLPTYNSGVQGRKFVGPLVEGRQNNGILDTTALTALAAYAIDVITTMVVSTETFSPGVMSSKLGQFVVYAGSIIPSVIGYQRRRKSGVGS